MPNYLYECECGTSFERFYRMTEDSQQTQCVKCDRQARKVLTPARLTMDYAPYQCPVTDKVISGRQAHLDNLKRHGCHVLEPGEREAAAARRAALDRQMSARVGDTVARHIDSLPDHHREVLANELVSKEPVIIRGAQP